ncbi:MAG: phenylalanyl-tRNA synthetase beta chain, partial [Actinomycetota bacterium]
GLAGVMGGLETEITDRTTTVVLEAAWFQAIPIMQTAARAGLRSEASARYERGTDPYVIDLAIARFAELLRETCPDLVVHSGTVDARGEGIPPAERVAVVRRSAVNRVLGTDLSIEDLPALLDPIGFAVTTGPESARVVLPSWRPDCEGEIDVIEEIARHHGYDRLGRTVPKSTVHGGLSIAQQRRRALREVLLGLGISEAMPNPFLGPDTLERAGLSGPTVRITNPLVAEESVLRTSLRPGLLGALAYNESHRADGVSLFEIGRVYPPGPGELPDEYEALCVVLAGREAPAAISVWREIAAALGIGARIDQSNVPAGLHATRSATLQAGRDPIGSVGEIDPAVLERFDVGERVAVLELHLGRVLGEEPRPAIWKPVSRYPSSDLDLAFVVPADVPAERLEKAIRQASGRLLVALELFDVFRDASLGSGRRSLAFRLRLQAPDRSLTDVDIADVRRACVSAAAKFGAELRG